MPTGDELLLERAEAPEVATEVEQRAGDHSGVITEEQPAECGDARGKHHIAADARRRLCIVPMLLCGSCDHGQEVARDRQ